MLSSRLNAFVIPTSHRRPIAHARMSLPTISTFSPLARTTTAATICAPSFAIGLRCRRSSTSPATKTMVTPARIPPSSLDHSTAPVARASRMPAENPAKIPTPPNVGVGCVVPALVRRDWRQAARRPASGEVARGPRRRRRTRRSTRSQSQPGKGSRAPGRSSPRSKSAYTSANRQLRG